MRSGHDRAVDMMLIRTDGGGSSASTTQIVQGGRASRVSGVRFESARHRDDRLRECRPIDISLLKPGVAVVVIALKHEDETDVPGTREQGASSRR
jgi:hypothetical protein